MVSAHKFGRCVEQLPNSAEQLRTAAEQLPNSCSKLVPTCRHNFVYPYIIFISSNARKRLALRPDPSIFILALTDTAQAVPLGVDMNM